MTLSNCFSNVQGGGPLESACAPTSLEITADNALALMLVQACTAKLLRYRAACTGSSLHASLCCLMNLL